MGVNRHPLVKRVQIPSNHGASLRSISSVPDAPISTVSKPLVNAGTVCATFDDKRVLGVKARRPQVDTIWSLSSRESTGDLERKNLTMRMHMRRSTQLPSRFSKKFENHIHMVALYTVWHNCVTRDRGLKGISPAMAAGLSAMPWPMTDVAEMAEAAQPEPGKRGPYEKRQKKFQAETPPDPGPP